VTAFVDNARAHLTLVTLRGNEAPEIKTHLVPLPQKGIQIGKGNVLYGANAAVPRLTQPSNLCGTQNEYQPMAE